MTKVILQIPCYNEEAYVGVTLKSLPRQIPGVDLVESMVVDDGSTDQTVSVARAHQVDHVISLPHHQGLAKCFMMGLQSSLQLGADIIVNLDADNQYCADDIPKLIEPILSGKAEIVIGTRPVLQMKNFSITKKYLQRFGSWVVRVVSHTNIPDAPSGFRAISRSAAMRLNVFSDYTYTLETIIQAGQKGMAIVAVPVRTNPDLRPSRLFNSLSYYLVQSVSTIVRIFMTYKPFRFFALPGMILFLLGFLIGLRFVYWFLTTGASGHIQSLILAALMMGMGFFLIVIGLVADLIGVNRKLLEKLDWRIQKIEETLREQSKIIDS